MAMGPTTTETVPQRTGALASPAPGGGLGGRGAAPAPAPAADPNAGNLDPSAVSPEEQGQYDEFVNQAYQLIYNGDQVNPQVLESLKGDGTPVDGLANATAMIVMRVEDSAGQAGKQLTPDVVFHGGTEILEDLADLAGQAGIHDYSDKELEGAGYQALDIYRDARQKEGSLDMGAIQQDFGEMIQADQMGTLDEILPGIGEKEANGAKSGKKRRRRGKRKRQGLM